MSSAAWNYQPLGDVAELITGPFGSSLKKHDYVLGGIPIINPMHIERGRLVPTPAMTVSPKTASRLDTFRLHTGDVVIGRRGEMGRCAVVTTENNGWLCGTGSLIVRPSRDVYAPYLQRFLSSPEVVAVLEGASVGSTMVNLNQRIMRNLEVPLPPLAEQKRIADKLDRLLAAVDTCKTRLDAIPAILKRFRQSVLSAATSGELTEGCASLDEWEEAEFGDVLIELRNGLSPKPREQPPGTPILRISSVRPGEIDQSDVRYLDADDETIERYRLRPKDLLFTRYNGTLEFVGVCAMYRRHASTILYPDKLIRARVDTRKVLPEFVELWFAAPKQRSAIESLVRSSAGQKGVSGADLKRLPIRLPTLREQQRIVAFVASALESAAAVEAKAAAGSVRSERLDKGLLRIAFCGDLAS
ncbi:type I restriction enzyme S subunit [Povalibacter uvarum]|uniref:Type I restriction enzyme S subunit n=1 Tax=Povalibacter uvarum TaxID=732238 RepID=A0A841HQJ2_9GAMM|nr:restriction endonuclease subunit S [Povalibacter uvarum]MBB6095621.1 type I restriction enzyme S subunit [Povalibacter uvarum]